MLSSAWELSLARISQQIIFKLQASSREQHCHPGFPSTGGYAPFVGNCRLAPRLPN
jgi:hypothetical protein